MVCARKIQCCQLTHRGATGSRGLKPESCLRTGRAIDIYQESNSTQAPRRAHSSASGTSPSFSPRIIVAEMRPAALRPRHCRNENRARHAAQRQPFHQSPARFALFDELPESGFALCLRGHASLQRRLMPKQPGIGPHGFAQRFDQAVSHSTSSSASICLPGAAGSTLADSGSASASIAALPAPRARRTPQPLQQRRV